MSSSVQSLLSELKTALVAAAPTWRSAVLRRVIDLFCGGAASFSAEQIDVFDEVMCRLIQTMDRASLAVASEGLAEIDNAPPKVLGALARHRNLAVAGPVLERAKALPQEVVAEIAGSEKTDPKALAKIAGRPALGEAATDNLIKRGTAEIQRQIIDNPDARISEAGFARLIMSINDDKNLAAAIAARNDVPAELQVWLARVLQQK